MSTLVSAMHGNGVSMDGVDGGGKTAMQYASQHSRGDDVWVESVHELVVCVTGASPMCKTGVGDGSVCVRVY